jgi:hypothetical protein
VAGASQLFVNKVEPRRHGLAQGRAVSAMKRPVMCTSSSTPACGRGRAVMVGKVLQPARHTAIGDSHGLASMLSLSAPGISQRFATKRDVDARQ